MVAGEISGKPTESLVSYERDRYLLMLVPRFKVLAVVFSLAAVSRPC